MEVIVDLLESPLLASALVLAVPLILGIVQAIKTVFKIEDDRWKPVVSIGTGMVLALLGLVSQKIPSAGEWILTLLLGLILGLAASGLYSSAKAVRTTGEKTNG